MRSRLRAWRRDHQWTYVYKGRCEECRHKARYEHTMPQGPSLPRPVSYSFRCDNCHSWGALVVLR